MAVFINNCRLNKCLSVLFPNITEWNVCMSAMKYDFLSLSVHAYACVCADTRAHVRDWVSERNDITIFVLHVHRRACKQWEHIGYVICHTATITTFPTHMAVTLPHCPHMLSWPGRYLPSNTSFSMAITYANKFTLLNTLRARGVDSEHCLFRERCRESAHTLWHFDPLHHHPFKSCHLPYHKPLQKRTVFTATNTKVANMTAIFAAHTNMAIWESILQTTVNMGVVIHKTPMHQRAHGNGCTCRPPDGTAIHASPRANQTE